MSAPLGYLRTRVARRVLLLFVVGALVPVLFMAGASFRAMSGQLREQSEERLRLFAGNTRQAILQQLHLTESRVRLTVEVLRGGGTAEDEEIPPSIQRIALEGAEGSMSPLLGPTFDAPTLDESQRAHLDAGELLVEIRPLSETPILTGLRVSLPGRPPETLWASVDGDSIWGAADSFASGGNITDFCVMAEGMALYCKSGLSKTADAFTAALADPPASGAVLVETPDGPLVIGHADVFLEASFAAPTLRVLVSEWEEDLYDTDLSLFRYSFGVALLLGLLLVVLLASIQVRRTMTPLEALAEGTARLAEGDLSTRVEVKSDDEFGALASSFNSMAGQLGIQFRTLEAGRAIDRAVLSAMDQEGVVDALLERFDLLVSCRSLAVLVLRPHHDVPSELYWKGPSSGGERGHARINLTLQDRRWLHEVDGHRTVVGADDRPPFLFDTEALGRHPLVALPLTSQGDLLGAVVFEARSDEVPSDEIISHGRQVADQATVAFDAVRLVGELEEMNWGALRALARAIDAKSRWTAGHSERVTEMALRIGRAMKLSEGDLEILERGGLLHDVGKIGVPARVLDSPGRLTPEEWALVREHPTIGVRILEPIRAFAPCVPIVLQHHERWDGKGYPQGLAGTEIHRLARIVAVADTYDAMASPRPYRNALARNVVLSEIEAGAGTQFEPFIVEVFIELMQQETERSVPEHVGEEGHV